MTQHELEMEQHIEELESQIAQKQDMLSEQEERLSRQEEKIDMLNKQLATLRKMLFASRTEATKKIIPVNENQILLFNEAEFEANPKSEEPSVTNVSPHTRKKSKKPNYQELLAKFPAEEIVYDVPEEDRHCEHHEHGELVQIGKELIRTEVQHIPAQIKVVKYYQMSYKCVDCAKEEHFTILKAPMPRPLFTNASIASASLVASIMADKYAMAMSLYRQEQEWKAKGIPLKRVNMSNWIMNAYEKYLSHLATYLLSKLVLRHVIHADETPVQVHRENDRKNTAKSYMWCCCTSPLDEGPDIRVFKYYAGRKGDFAKDLLNGFTGVLMHDQYAGYNQLKNVTHAGCLVHMRREFVNALPAKEDLREDTLAGQAILKLKELFVIEGEIKELPPNERETERQKREKPLLDDFFAWAESHQGEVPRSSKTAKAFQYAFNHKASFYTYLYHGTIGIDNSVAENAIRPFVIGRKNWMFADSPRGAKASAAIYSLVETCKANGVDPYRYFEYILGRMSNEDFLVNPELLEDYMPWSQSVQLSCKVKLA